MKAADAYRRGCDRGDTEACGAGALLMILGKPSKRLEEGLALARKTCERGHADSCSIFGALSAITAWRLSEYEDAVQMADRGCQSGSATACGYRSRLWTNAFQTSTAPTEALGLSLYGDPRHVARWCANRSLAPEAVKLGIVCRDSDGNGEVMVDFEPGTIKWGTFRYRLDGGASEWVSRFKLAAFEVRKMYGASSALEVRGGSCARSVAQERACLSSGQVKLLATWLWKDRNITVSVNHMEGIGPVLMTAYGMKETQSPP